LRPLALALNFLSTTPDNPYIEAFAWLKQIFGKGQHLSDQLFEQLPNGTIPKRLRPYFFTFDEQGREKSLRDNRFEFFMDFSFGNRERKVFKNFFIGNRDCKCFLFLMNSHTYIVLA